jgi:hypothetical protein
VIEVIREYSWGGGGQSIVEKNLFVRLSQDGRVEWAENGQNNLESARISPEQVSAVVSHLDAVDSKAISGRMGPYNVYKDTGVDLHIRILTSKWNRRFSVENPWPGIPIKPLPKELTAVICEIDRLRAKVAEEPVESMCAQEPAATDAPTSQR